MTANNNGWIEWIWTEEKPYPESLDTMVEVKLKCGYESFADTVQFWHEMIQKDSSWYQDGQEEQIVAYRVVN